MMHRVFVLIRSHQDLVFVFCPGSTLSTGFYNVDVAIVLTLAGEGEGGGGGGGGRDGEGVGSCLRTGGAGLEGW